MALDADAQGDGEVSVLAILWDCFAHLCDQAHGRSVWRRMLDSYGSTITHLLVTKLDELNCGTYLSNPCYRPANAPLSGLFPNPEQTKISSLRRVSCSHRLGSRRVQAAEEFEFGVLSLDRHGFLVNRIVEGERGGVVSGWVGRGGGSSSNSDFCGIASAGSASSSGAPVRGVNAKMSDLASEGRTETGIQAGW